jgi:mannose-6-phosphate isomerase-like protein (cupin superfamily)
LEYIKYKEKLYAIIVRDDYKSDSIAFFTPDNSSQQLGYLPHDKGGIIIPHMHNRSEREVFYTDEVLFIKKGKVRVNFYNSRKKLIRSEILKKGDTILLCGGGHGFKMLEKSVMIEVKQGPYLGADDKTRFKGVER